MLPNRSQHDLPPTVSRDMAPPPLDVLMHDADYVVINKSANLRLDGNFDHTVEKQLKDAFPSSSHTLKWIHQLDYATSGVLCIGLNRRAAAKASLAFAERLTKKSYLAVVRGHVNVASWRQAPQCPPVTTHVQSVVGGNTKAPGTVLHDAAAAAALTPHDFADLITVGDDGDLRVTVPVAEVENDFRCVANRVWGKPCETVVRVVRHATHRGLPVTKLLLMPKTGRRHQLRVHCLALGHPIVGDYTYAQDRELEDASVSRMCLHAWKLKVPLITPFQLRAFRQQQQQQQQQPCNTDKVTDTDTDDADHPLLNEHVIDVATDDPFPVTTDGELVVLEHGEKR